MIRYNIKYIFLCIQFSSKYTVNIRTTYLIKWVHQFCLHLIIYLYGILPLLLFLDLIRRPQRLQWGRMPHPQSFKTNTENTCCYYVYLFSSYRYPGSAPAFNLVQMFNITINHVRHILFTEKFHFIVRHLINVVQIF